MTDFVEYIVSEMKSRRLSKDGASSLIAQFHARSAAGAPGGVIHPLLHRNTSDLSEQRFATAFDGDEPFLRDHQVHGQKVLPGVACLEMVRAAVEQAMPAMPPGSIVELRDVVWVQPVIVAEPKEVSIALFTDSEAAAGKLDYEIYSEDTIHSQGQAALVAHSEPPRLDLDALKARMRRGTLGAPDLYPAYERMGICYGPSQQALSAIHRGERELLAEISLPAAAQAISDGSDGYVLHPSLMDAALQAPIGFIDDIATVPDRALLPFALQSVRIISACTPQMFAWLRYSPDEVQQGALTRIDIDVCDGAGKVCVQLRGFAFREVGTRAAPAEKTEALEVLHAVPQWQAAPFDAARRLRSDDSAQQLVLWGLPDINPDELQALIPKSRCQRATRDGGKSVAERYREAAMACFELIRQALQDKSQGKTLVQVVVADTPEDSMLVGLSGLLRTAAIENPRISGQLVLVRPDIGAQELATLLRAENSGAHENVVRLGQGARQVLRLRELQADAPVSLPAFKHQGVYLITGGLGGLGLLFAQEILREAGDATIVLTGRSAPSDDKRRELASLGGRVAYRPLDVADAGEVDRLVRAIVDEHGQLNGIIHAAGVRSDSFILKKSAEEFARVLAPKVSGTLNLDHATREVDLDFMVLFSSGASVMGNSGQADYAAANGFMDQFARHRNELAARGQRRGKTLAINWPLWQDGGMGVDAEIQEWFERAYGIQPLSTADGLRAFHDGLNSGPCQMLVMAGDAPKLRSAVLAACASREALSDEQIEEQLAALFSLPTV